ncbi:MAG: hypothetical protein LUJ25_06980 [Firmicutes bacterium]|nr:hypothetical protein [Bacillota bacterium]
MIYNDGYEVDENLRFIKCPRCGNEQYSDNAKYCRICGFNVYNECEGDYERDEYGNQEGPFQIHRNVGNARYCEFCGQPTMLLKEKLLRPYTEVQTSQEDEEVPFDSDGLPFY